MNEKVKEITMGHSKHRCLKKKPNKLITTNEERSTTKGQISSQYNKIESQKLKVILCAPRRV